MATFLSLLYLMPELQLSQSLMSEVCVTGTLDKDMQSKLIYVIIDLLWVNGPRGIHIL